MTPLSDQMTDRRRRPGVRARRASARPHPRPVLGQPGTVDQSARPWRRPTSSPLHAEGGQACVQVFFFRAGQNWGNRAYFPAWPTRSRATTRPPASSTPSSASSTRTRPIPRLILVSHEPPNRELLAEAFSLKAGRKVEIARPQRGEKRELVDHALTNAREALGRQDGGELGPGQAAGRGRRGLRPGGAARADRGLRQLPHHGDQRRRRHDRRRAGRLPEEPVPQVQHQEHGTDPRRRLRHDARGAAPPLRPPGQGGGGRRGPAAARTWC